MGVARLQKGSLIATAVFFGTAIVASLAVDAILGAEARPAPTSSSG
jgi:hypothetical protein